MYNQMSRKTWIILILLVGTQKATAFEKQYSRVLKKKKKKEVCNCQTFSDGPDEHLFQRHRDDTETKSCT